MSKLMEAHLSRKHDEFRFPAVPGRLAYLSTVLGNKALLEVTHPKGAKPFISAWVRKDRADNFEKLLKSERIKYERYQ
jgi:hypothetical protein